MNKLILLAIVALAVTQVVSAVYVDPAADSYVYKEIAGLEGFYKLFANFCLKQYSYFKVEFSKLPDLANGPDAAKPYAQFCGMVDSVNAKIANDFYTTVEQLKRELPEKVVQDFLRIDVTLDNVSCPSIGRFNMLAAACRNQQDS